MDTREPQSKLLDEIIFNKRQEVTSLKLQLKLNKLPKERKNVCDFYSAFPKGKISLIAEVKKASPSAGVIVEDFDPVDIAKAYEKAGAAALSVVTDQKYFQGEIRYLERVKLSAKVPVLRKDFIIDESQIYESYRYGADAVLLIARILTDEQLIDFIGLTKKLKLRCLVEVHDGADTERALRSRARIIGINNRDLDTLAVDLQTTFDLIDKFPELKKGIIISESGISSPEQVRALREKGVSGILVGESLLRSSNVAEKIKRLMGGG